MGEARVIETFTAYFKDTGDDVDAVTVVRDVYAGVSGPYGPDLDAHDHESADAALFAEGFLRCGPWEAYRGGWTAPLTRMN